MTKKTKEKDYIKALKTGNNILNLSKTSWVRYDTESKVYRETHYKPGKTFPISKTIPETTVKSYIKRTIRNL